MQINSQQAQLFEDAVRLHMKPLEFPSSDEVIVIHIVESFIMGRPKYVANILSSLSDLDRKFIEAALHTSETTSDSFRLIYESAGLPIALFSFFEMTARICIDLYEEYGGPFSLPQRRIASTRVLTTGAVENLRISEQSWRHLLFLLD